MSRYGLTDFEWRVIEPLLLKRPKACRARWPHPDDQQHFRSRPPASNDGNKGDRDHCLGHSRDGLTTKIHAVIDGQGLPIRLSLTAGLSHDGQAANDLLDHVGAGTIVLADKAHDADRIRVSLREKGAFANILPKFNRRSKPYFSTWLYREPNLLELFFSKQKHFRRFAIRYDKMAENFMAMVQLASMRLWFRAYESTA